MGEQAYKYGKESVYPVSEKVDKAWDKYACDMIDELGKKLAAFS